MRTANVLKQSAYVVIPCGTFLAFKNFSISTGEFWCVVASSLLLWLVLRLVAIMGELLYGMRHDTARMLSNIERSMYQVSAVTQETRDILDREACRKSS